MMRPLWFTACNIMVKAIEENNYNAVKKLLDNGFDVDAELMPYKYAITMCVGCNRFEIGKLLISNGCSLSLKSIKGSTPLHLAVQLLNFDFVTLLLDNRADLTSIDYEGKTVLHLAAQQNSIRMVELLMAKCTPEMLSIKDHVGKTPFIYACSHGSEALVSYFLSKGSDVNCEFGICRSTPIFSAMSFFNCSVEKVTMLLDAGANINHINSYQETCLLKAFYALGSNHFKKRVHEIYYNICHLLLDRGCDVNVRNTLGDTPLHFAVHMNDEVLVRKLLNAGSNLNHANDLGHTPIFYACKHGYQTIAILLLNCGAYVCRSTLAYEVKYSLASYILKKSRECLSLQNSCRQVIRGCLTKNIDKNAPFLPLPHSLIKFIQLVE